MPILERSAIQPDVASDLTSVEAAAVLLMHPVSVLRQLQAGRLRGRKRAGVWLLNALDVQRLAEERAQKEADRK